MSLCDEVASYDVERADFGAGGLLSDPGEQGRVRGHHQVLQGLSRVGADVLQVLRQINPSDKETA